LIYEWGFHFTYNLKRISLLLVPLFIFLSVGLWTGILVNPQKFESLEIRNAIVNAIDGGWLVTMYVRNIGTIDAEIRYIDVNNTIVSKDSGLTNIDALVIRIQSEAEIWVKISNPPYQRGTSAFLTIHTTEGNQYSQLVIIPEFGFEE